MPVGRLKYWAVVKWVRHSTLTAAFVGSSPTSPAKKRVDFLIFWKRLLINGSRKDWLLLRLSKYDCLFDVQKVKNARYMFLITYFTRPENRKNCKDDLLDSLIYIFINKDYIIYKLFSRLSKLVNIIKYDL